MKTSVQWHAREGDHAWEFEGRTQDGHVTQIAARTRPEGVKSAPTPKELVAMAMGSCTGIDVVSILQKMRQPLASLRIETDVTVTKTEPAVFETCVLSYHVEGEGLVQDRVVRAVTLSFTKHCGVSIMIERSGCRVEPRLFINGASVALTGIPEGHLP